MSSNNVTKDCACHVKWHASLILVAHETSVTMRGATGITFQPHQILRLPRKIALQNLREICRKRLKRHLQWRTIREWSDRDPTMIRAWNGPLAPAHSPRLVFALRSRILYWKLQHFALRLSSQISPNTVPATKSDTPRSPNTAPATKNDSHHWFPWHMKRHLQCAEQQVSYTNVTQYCACHVEWLASLILVTYETSFTMRGATDVIQQRHQGLRLPRKMTRIIDPRGTWKVIYNARSNRHHLPTSPNTVPATQNCTPKSKRNLPKTIEASFTMADDSRMIRPWSDHELVISHPPIRRGYFLRFGAAFCTENYNISRSGYLSKFHQILRLLSDTPRSPNTAPATKNDSHHWFPWHMKRHLQCAEQQASPSNLTKYCACHAKLHSKI